MTQTTVPDLADFAATNAPASSTPAAQRCRVCRTVPAELLEQLKKLKTDVSRARMCAWLDAKGISGISRHMLSRHLNDIDFPHDHGATS